MNHTIMQVSGDTPSYYVVQQWKENILNISSTYIEDIQSHFIQKYRRIKAQNGGEKKTQNKTKEEINGNSKNLK